MTYKVPFTGLVAGDQNTVYAANSMVITGAGGNVLVNSNVYVDGNGNVGIGTTLPTAKLNVYGAAVITGSVGINGNLNVGGATQITGNLVVTGEIFSPSITVNLPLALNDVSNQTNGLKTVFQLKTNQTLYTGIVDSKNLEVVINGNRLSPYVTQITYPWFTTYYGSWPGYRVSGGNVIIYNAPDIGSRVSLTVLNKSITKQTQRYPFLPTTIVLGD